MTDIITVRALRTENRYLHKTVTENETLIDDLVGWLLAANEENAQLKATPTLPMKPVLRVLPGRSDNDVKAGRAAVWKRRHLETQVAALTAECENLKAELVLVRMLGATS